MRSSAPYFWRWGLIAFVVGLVFLPFGVHLTDRGHADDEATVEQP
jgi:hypothetical protein